MAMWTSPDQGKTWNKEKQLTRNSPRNQSYACRPLNAHPVFYAIWADGDGRAPSKSNLYFTNQKGTNVWRLPSVMKVDFEMPEVAW